MREFTSQEITEIVDSAKSLVIDANEWIVNRQTLAIEAAEQELSDDPGAADQMIGAIREKAGAGVNVSSEALSKALLRAERTGVRENGKRTVQANVDSESRLEGQPRTALIKLLIRGADVLSYAPIVNGCSDLWRTLFEDVDTAAVLSLHDGKHSIVCRNGLTGFDDLAELMRFDSAFSAVCWFGEQIRRYVDTFDCLPHHYWEHKAAEIIRLFRQERAQAAGLLFPCTEIEWIHRRIDYEAKWLRHANGLIPEPARWEFERDIHLTDGIDSGIALTGSLVDENGHSVAHSVAHSDAKSGALMSENDEAGKKVRRRWDEQCATLLRRWIKAMKRDGWIPMRKFIASDLLTLQERSPDTWDADWKPRRFIDKFKDNAIEWESEVAEFRV